MKNMQFVLVASFRQWIVMLCSVAIDIDQLVTVDNVFKCSLRPNAIRNHCTPRFE